VAIETVKPCETDNPCVGITYFTYVVDEYEANHTLRVFQLLAWTVDGLTGLGAVRVNWALCACLVADSSLRNEMMARNWQYYREYLSPDRFDRPHAEHRCRRLKATMP
jgi:hypothetical protein